VGTERVIGRCRRLESGGPQFLLKCRSGPARRTPAWTHSLHALARADQAVQATGSLPLVAMMLQKIPGPKASIDARRYEPPPSLRELKIDGSSAWLPAADYRGKQIAINLGRAKVRRSGLRVAARRAGPHRPVPTIHPGSAPPCSRNNKANRNPSWRQNGECERRKGHR